MQPNAPNARPPIAPSDYDFILNHGANKPKPSLLPGFGGSKKQRLLVMGLGGAILLMLIILGYSLLFGGNKNQTVLEVAQSQQELIRVSTLGADKTTRGSAARALATTTELTLISNQKEVIAQLKKHGQKTNTKNLAVKKNAQTDAALQEAALNNRYDEVFTQLLQKQLVEYQKLLKTAYGSTSNQTLQNLLNSEFAQAGLLIASAQPTT